MCHEMRTALQRLCVFSLIAVCATATTGCGSRRPASIAVTPRTGTFDVPFTVRATGLPRDTTASVIFSGRSETGATLSGGITRRTDARGDLVVADEFAYARMAPPPGTVVPWPERVTVHVEAGSTTLVGHATRRPIDPSQATTTDERPNRVGFFGEWHTPKGARHHTAILLFGGSEGGLYATNLADTLAAHGYPVLHLAYFAEPGLPQTLTNIPLGYFEHALEWMARRPQVDPNRIVTWGGSRGGELSLILASMFPRLVHGAVAYVPSSYVIPSPSNRRHAAWTYRGKPLRAYSVIPVWKSSGPIFAVGGYDDQLWSSGFYVDQVRREMHAHGRHDVTALTYEHAGHLLVNAVPPQLRVSPVDYGLISASAYGPLDLGGSPKADEAALESSWPQVLRFLAQIK
jgi:dienelactone hydrolase